MQVVIINGCGGVGKDTIVKLVQNRIQNVENISVIQRVKAVAGLFGWSGRKSAKDRKFLSDLYNVWKEYNDTPRKWVISAVEEFKNRKDTSIVFIHARDPLDIHYLKGIFEDDLKLEVSTILVRRPGVEGHGNDADDQVESYDYDFYINNNGDMIDLKKKVLRFLSAIGWGLACEESSKRNLVTKDNLDMAGIRAPVWDYILNRG